jgi:hypothetical protein
MLENYFNVKGANRVRKSWFGRRGFTHNIKKASELVDQTKMLDDDKRTALEQEIKKAEDEKKKLDSEKSELDSGRVSVDTAKIIQAKLAQKVAGLAKQKAILANRRTKLAASGANTSAIDTQIAELDHLDTEMNANLSSVDSQIASGAGSVDISSALNGDYSDQFSAEIFNKDVATNSLKNQIKEQVEELDGLSKKLAADKNLKQKHMGDENASLSPDAKQKILKDYTNFKKKAEELERPEAYYARAARIQREDEETKKIAKIHDEAELNKLLRNAVNLKDTPKAVAILKKLTRDRNLNEATEDWGFSTDFEGVQGLLTKILHEKLGVQHEEMMEIVTEIGYEAEESKQYNAARLTKVGDDGHLTWQNAKDHTDAVYVEMSKSEPRKRYGELPRWNYVVEGVDEYGSRTIKGWSEFGKKTLLDAAGNVEATRNITSQGNTYAMKAIMKIEGWENNLMTEGVSQGKRPEDIKTLIEAIKTAGGKGTGKGFSAAK